MKDQIKKKKDWLISSNFGEADAEREQGQFAEFFVETYAWHRLINGNVTIVHGRKGSGKSALYSALIREGQNVLRDKNIYVVHGNHLDLVGQLPQTVPEGFNWSDFWYCYILIVSAGRILQENWSICPEIVDYLQAKELLDNNPNNQLFLRRLAQFVWETRGGLSYEEVFRRSSMESGGYMGGHMSDMTISRSSHVTSRPAMTSTEIKVTWSSLLQHVHGALATLGVKFWIALDKLDVVFSELPKVEAEAINGLLRCNENMGSFTHLRLRLFLQTQSFQRAKYLGLTNPDHLATSIQELQWDANFLTRLLMRRLLTNSGVIEFLSMPTFGRVDVLGDFRPGKGSDVILGNVLEHPPKQDFVLRAIFETPKVQAVQEIRAEEKKRRAQEASDSEVDDGVLDMKAKGFMGEIMEILAIDKSQYNPRDFVTFMSHAVREEISLLEKGRHDGFDYLISHEAVNYALEKVAVDKLTDLASRYKLMTGANLQPYLIDLKKLVSGGRSSRKVTELLTDWTAIAGDYQSVARDTLKWCYEHNLFKNNRSAEDELLRGSGRTQPTLVLTPIYLLGFKNIHDHELSVH